MRYLFVSLIISVIAYLSSCDKVKSFPCEISIMCKKSVSDRIKICCLEQDYYKTRVLYDGVLKDSTISITENCNLNNPRIGYFVLSSDSVPHYFIIEPGKIIINRIDKFVILNGSKKNRTLINLRGEINKIIEQKAELLKEYNQLLADSILTQRREYEIHAKDSALYSKLQNKLVLYLNNDDITSKILKEEFYKYLSDEIWQMLH